MSAGGDRDDFPEALAGHHASRRRLAREDVPRKLISITRSRFFDVHVEHREGRKNASVGHHDVNRPQSPLRRREEKFRTEAASRTSTTPAKVRFTSKISCRALDRVLMQISQRHGEHQLRGMAWAMPRPMRPLGARNKNDLPSSVARHDRLLLIKTCGACPRVAPHFFRCYRGSYPGFLRAGLSFPMMSGFKTFSVQSLEGNVLDADRYGILRAVRSGHDGLGDSGLRSCFLLFGSAGLELYDHGGICRLLSFSISCRVGRNTISLISASSGWVMAKATRRANEVAGIAASAAKCRTLAAASG